MARYVDYYAFHGDGEEQQTAGIRQLQDGSFADFIYASFPSEQHAIFTSATLQTMRIPTFFLQPKPNPVNETTLAFAHPGKEFKSWFGSLPRVRSNRRVERYPTEQRRDMIRRLIICQYQATRQQRMIKPDMDAMFVNDNDNPQIIRFEYYPTRDTIDQFIELLERILGTADHSPPNRENFRRALRRLYNDDGNINDNDNFSSPDDDMVNDSVKLQRVYYHPMLWTLDETVSFLKNIGDNYDRYNGSLDTLICQWMDAFLYNQGPRGGMYTDGPLWKPYFSNKVWYFFEYMRAIFKHIGAYVDEQNRGIEEVFVVGDVYQLAPDILVRANNRLIRDNASYWDLDIVNGWVFPY